MSKYQLKLEIFTVTREARVKRKTPSRISEGGEGGVTNALLN